MPTETAPKHPVKRQKLSESPTRYLDTSQAAIVGRDLAEKEAASALLGMSRIQPENLNSAEWQDSIMLDVANVIRNPSADDEEESLLKLQAMINEKLAKAKERSTPINEMQRSVDEQIIVNLDEHAQEEEQTTKSGRTTRNSKRARPSENGIDEKASAENGAIGEEL